MTPESALLYFLAIFVFAVTPGPGIFAILARGMASGARACWPLALGMTLSDLLYLMLAFHGLAVLAEHYSEAFTLIRYVGAGYLFYLAWKLWRSPVGAAAALAAMPRRSDIVKGFLQGFLISASNPKVILFYIAFLPTFVDLTALAAGDMPLTVALTFSGLMLGLMLVAAGAGGARRFLQTERAMRGANRSAGALMAAAGAFLVAKG